MELKRCSVAACAPLVLCLNRTFYGIETRKQGDGCAEAGSLNRTFYGIETKY